VPEEGSKSNQLVDFHSVSEFIIPHQAVCNRYITVRDPSGEYRILGHPVCINDDQRYERNEFIFNFGIICSANYDSVPYEAVIRRLATTFTEMEVQNQYLSLEGTVESKGRRSIGALLEIIREDLNNYNECMIPIGKSSSSLPAGGNRTD
jgi:nitrogen permease regulator 2-like protein